MLTPLTMCLILACGWLLAGMLIAHALRLPVRRWDLSACPTPPTAPLRLVTAPGQSADELAWLMAVRRDEIVVLRYVGMTNLRLVTCYECPSGVMVGLN
jgi:hypothetical protein